MSADDHLSGPQFFTGYMPTKALRPTENTPETEKWARRGAGYDYQQALVSHVAEHGMPGPIEVDYHAGGPTMAGRSKVAQPYVRDGHHRYHAAKQLGMPHVPVTLKSYADRPPELLDELPD
jgi:hypothetical protein